jgi:hypothetical protein
MHPDEFLYDRVPPTRGASRVAIAGAILFAGVLASGCVVTKDEYGDFVKASRGFFDSVGPVFSATTASDPGLSDQSKKNRLKELAAYEGALKAAEERVK